MSKGWEGGMSELGWPNLSRCSVPLGVICTGMQDRGAYARAYAGRIFSRMGSVCCPRNWVAGLAIPTTRSFSRSVG